MPFISDDFSGGSLAGHWTLSGGGTAVAVSGTPDNYLELTVPNGSFNAWGPNTAVRLIQAIENTDFEIEARFLSDPTGDYQNHGLLVETDADNYIRYDVFHDGSNYRLFVARTANQSSTSQHNAVILAGDANYLRLTRSGNTWTFRYSSDGITWTTAETFVYPMTVNAAGVFGAAQNNGYVAQVDYIFNTASPVSPEDDAGPTNTAPDAQDNALATSENTALTINIAADLLANDSDPDNDNLSLQSFTQPGNGVLVDNGNGTLTYTPGSGYSGTDSFNYTITDGSLTGSATVTITVTAAPEPAVVPILGKRAARLKRLRNVVDRHIGTAVRIKPVTTEDFIGAVADPARPEFECKGLLKIGRGDQVSGIDEFRMVIPAGRALLFLQPDQLPDGMILERGDQIKALEYDDQPTFEILQEHHNQLGRLIYELGAT